MTPQELKVLRESHHLTQRAIGELLGYTANYISRLERGDETITHRFEKLVRSMLHPTRIKKDAQPT